MAECYLPQFQQDRKIIRREFSKWTKNILLQIGLETISKNHFLYDIDIFHQTKDEQMPVDFNPNQICLFCINRQDYCSNQQLAHNDTHAWLNEGNSPLDFSPIWTSHRTHSDIFSTYSPEELNSCSQTNSTLIDRHTAQLAKQMAYSRMREEMEFQRKNPQSNVDDTSLLIATESIHVNLILKEIMIRVLTETFTDQLARRSKQNNNNRFTMKKHDKQNNQIDRSSSSSSSSSSISSTCSSSIPKKNKNQSYSKRPSSQLIVGIDGRQVRAKRGHYRRYDYAQLKKAVTAVLSNQMSAHKAGSYFGVPHSTVEHKVKERTTNMPTTNNKYQSSSSILSTSVNDDTARIRTREYETIMADNHFGIDYAKLGTSGCKKCKAKIAKGEIRIAKITPSPFSEGDTMKIYHHVPCMFETFLHARATTKIIESATDLDGWSNISPADREIILDQIKQVQTARTNKTTGKSPTKKAAKPAAPTTPKKTPTKRTSAPPPAAASSSVPVSIEDDDESTIDNDDIAIIDDKDDVEEVKDVITTASSGVHIPSNDDPKHPDNSFRQFRGLCTKIAEVNGHLAKTSIVEQFITYGCDGESYKGNLSLLFHLLLPSKGYKSIIYNLKSKQLCKLFATIFHGNATAMIQKCEESGDVAETISEFYSKSTHVKPPPKTVLSNYDIDKYLHELGQFTREQDQIQLLRKITEHSTVNDLRMFIRLIQKDLKINSGPKQIIDSLGSNAYESFQATNDLKSFIKRYLEHKTSVSNGTQLNKQLSIKIELMTPVHPMLAEPCKSVDFAFKRCPNGCYAEIKYDGERLQLHKDKTNKFKFFSRSLKPVVEHKIDQLSQFVLKAFPKGESMILDGEILLVDRKTNKPLPFGTLGVHKKKEFSEANEAFFIFDCLYYNGESLLHKTLKERREVLVKHMSPIENRILLSDLKTINKKSELKHLINFTIAEGLEGLVLKNPDGIYEPSKRHWLKVKKDYLMEGTMADTADLVVLGAYYGTGKKGGLMSVFLLGCYDQETDRWYTVAKCGNGFDDATLEKLQNDLKPNITKISKNPNQIPKWFSISRELIPDFIVIDPKKSPVWEITGAEFSKSKQHTANGISIRFPRVTKVREDKTWKEATSLTYLTELFEKSKPSKQENNDDEDEENLFNFGDNNNNSSPKKPTPTKRKLLEIDSDDDLDMKPTTNKIIRKSLPNSLLKLHFPNIFATQYMYLSSSLPIDEYNKLKRHIEAYGGKVCSPKDVNNDLQLSRITHCIGERDATFDQIDSVKQKIQTNVTHISLPTVYVWKCIANKTKL